MERRVLCFLVILVFSLILSLYKVEAQNGNCCCGEGWVIVAPLSITMECLYQHDYGTFQWQEKYTGYGAELDGCPFNGVTQYCHACVDCVFPPNHQDKYGVTGTPSLQTTAVPNGCTNTNAIEITRYFCGDCGGNTICATQLISILDTVPPELFIPDGQTIECFSTDGVAGDDVAMSRLDALFGAARSTDLCTNPTLSETQSTSGDTCNFRINRNYFSTDGCNSVSSTQTDFIVDTTPPVLISPNALLYYSCENPNIFSSSVDVPTVKDSCDNAVNSPTILSNNIYPGKCTGDYTIERIWQASDTCGNIGETTQIIVVEDTTPPTVTRNGKSLTDLNIFQDYYCGIPPLSNYVVSDNCASTTNIYFSYDESIAGINNFENRFDLIRTYTASDDCGNTIQWQEVYDVFLDSDVYILSPGQLTASKGTTITVTFDLSISYLCKTGYFVVDYGAATFVGINLNNCSDFTGGVLVCPIPRDFEDDLTINLRIFVASNYAPNSLEVQASFIGGGYNYDYAFTSQSSATVIIFN